MTKGSMHIIKEDEIKGEAPELFLEELRCKLYLVQEAHH